MTQNAKLTVIMEKHSRRRLDARVMRQQLSYVIKRALASNRGKVWDGQIGSPKPSEIDDGWVYSAKLTFVRTGRGVPENVLHRQQETIQQMVTAAGRCRGWMIAGEDNVVATRKTGATPTSRTYADVLGSLEKDHNQFFSHLYDREAQIAITLSAIRAYAQSNFEERFHAILYGPPACGKTEILRSFTRWLGEETVLHFDGTSTTKAGAERILLETQHIPPILMVEEIEKTDPDSLRWLLGVLDHRGEVRKITHHMVAHRRVQLLCLATVNDLPLFKRVMDGALESRFAHKIHCPRPSREVLRKILEREIGAHGGNADWIDPALAWCLDEEKTSDPRRVIAVCMSGRDDLLTGQYQEALGKTIAPKEIY